jgi:hypothetical protein
MLVEAILENMMKSRSAQRSGKMVTLQWIPLISTLSMGIGFIVIAYFFATLTV